MKENGKERHKRVVEGEKVRGRILVCQGKKLMIVKLRLENLFFVVSKVGGDKIISVPPGCFIGIIVLFVSLELAFDFNTFSLRIHCKLFPSHFSDFFFKKFVPIPKT